jgi:formate dehydrogenase assembly factor FdhD
MQSNESLEDSRAENLSRENKKQSGRKSNLRNNSAENDKIRVYVKSSRTVISVVETGYPSYMPSSFSSLAPQAGSGGKRIFSYANQLDAEQEEIVHNAAAFAERMGMRLEVKDLGRQNILERLFTRLRNGAVTTPSIVFPGRRFVEMEQGLSQGVVANVPMLQSTSSSASCTGSCSCSVSA